MARKSQCISISALLGFVLAICGLSHAAMGQAAPAPSQQPSSKTTQFKPVSLAHLYWHFLTLQNHLDTKATELESQGKDGSGLRNQLQKTLGWSDTDYAPIRTSSVRLTAKVKDLDVQAVAIRKAGPSSSNYDQLKALTVQREADINSEISYLKQSLTPDKTLGFESFLTKLFSLTNASPRPPLTTGKLSVTGQQPPAGVQ